MKSLSTALLALLLVTAGFAHSAELDQAKEDQARQIFDSVMSPFCPGRLLRDCPSSAAGELKDEIRKKVSDGQSNQEVMADLVSRYGSQVEAAPAMQGFGAFAWLAPFVFLVLGLAMIKVWLKRRISAPTPALPEIKIDPEMQARIDAEIGKIGGGR